MQEIKVGDLVRLKGHSVEMTVNGLTSSHAICLWFMGYELRQYSFSIEALVHAKPQFPAIAENCYKGGFGSTKEIPEL